MQNKSLCRILKKNLGLKTRDEFIGLLSNLKEQVADPVVADNLNHFFSDLLEMFDMIDKTFSDLDRDLYLRETSMVISSRELTALNEEIQAQSSRQAAILQRLQATVRLLSQSEFSKSDGQGLGHGDDKAMEKLVEMVDSLVQAKLDSAKLQQSLYEEGLRICSVLSFRNLEVQLRNSINSLTGMQIEFSIFFSGSLFEGKDPIEFYQCDDYNEPIDKKRLSLLSSESSSQFLNIESPKGNGTLAVLQLKFQENLSQEEQSFQLSRITPLIPSVGSTLENIRLLKEEKRKQFIEAELDTIRLVQYTLLPPSSPQIASKDIEVSGYYQSATECSGDWWSYFQLDDGRHILLVGDVTGHGTGSAMVCAVVKGYCDSFLGRAHLSISEILGELNSVIYRMSKDNNRAMTMAAIAIDTARGKLTFSNAGHPLPMLAHTEGDKTQCRYLLNSGPILGMGLDVYYKEVEFDFRKGDRLVLYSDGLTECANSQDAMYGENRLQRLVKSFGSVATAGELNRAIIQDVQRFSKGQHFADDLTTVVIRNLVEPMPLKMHLPATM